MELVIPAHRQAEIFRRIDPDQSQWWHRDIIGSYPWLSAKALRWCVSNVAGAAVIAFDDRGDAWLYDTPEGMDRLSRDMATAFSGNPFQHFTPEQFARHCVVLLDDPRPVICTPRWFAALRDTTEGWLRGTEKNPESLRSLCGDPVSERIGDRWRLSFTTLEHTGAVARREITGMIQPFSIDHAGKTAVARPGTFSYPLEF